MYSNPAVDCSKFSKVQMEESLVLSSQHPDQLWYEQAFASIIQCQVHCQAPSQAHCVGLISDINK